MKVCLITLTSREVIYTQNHAWAASVNAPASLNIRKLTGAIGICYGLDKSMELYGLGVPSAMTYIQPMI